MNYPRQSYALSGMDFGDASENKTNGKLTIVGAPMFISTMPPGCTADSDEQWQQTYGASQDAVMALLDGSELFTNVQASLLNIQFPYSTVLPIANNINLYDKPNGQQQIQFVASKSTVDIFRQADDFGTIAEARGIGMRAPMMMAGWGRTVGLRPTDPDPSDPRSNDLSHKLDRSTWKVGPFDCGRWDNERRVWRGWNDLIADHEAQNLGALVFSTNPDSICGFPRLRGLLEDVWWVRRTDNTKPVNPDNDTTGTGEVCTTLKHKLFDPARNGAGALHDIFICHLGDSKVCGSETTLIGSTATTPPQDGDSSANPQGSLEIRCSSIFHWSDAIGTSIEFDPAFNASFQGGNNLVGGVMGIVNGRWGPIVDVDQIWKTPAFDLCAKFQYRLHMSTLTKNSKAVTEDGVFTLESFICEWNEEYTKCLLEHIAWLAHNAGAALWAINFLLPALIKDALTALATNTHATIVTAVGGLTNSVRAAIKSLVTQIQLCFSQLEISCPLEFVIKTPKVPPIPVEINPFDVPGKEPPPCIIKSFATWEFTNFEFLDVTVNNPCLGPTNLTSSCTATGAPDRDSINPDDLERGGTDAEGDVDIAGKSFGNPSEGKGDPNGGIPPGND